MNDLDYQAELRRITRLMDTLSDGFEPPSSFNQLAEQLKTEKFRWRIQYLDAMCKRAARTYGRTIDQFEQDLIVFGDSVPHTS